MLLGDGVRGSEVWQHSDSEYEPDQRLHFNRHFNFSCQLAHCNMQAHFIHYTKRASGWCQGEIQKPSACSSNNAWHSETVGWQVNGFLLVVYSALLCGFSGCSQVSLELLSMEMPFDI